MKDRRLNPDEEVAWSRVKKSIRPLGAPETKRFEASDAFSEAYEIQMAQVPPKRSPASPVEYRAGERMIRRGRAPVFSSFDLHGHTQISAWHALPEYLRREQMRGARCVIVITGKGKSGEGVLRRNFLRWLDMPEARALVSGYSEAHPKHGGTGAWYVFLRKP